MFDGNRALVQITPLLAQLNVVQQLQLELRHLQIVGKHVQLVGLGIAGHLGQIIGAMGIVIDGGQLPDITKLCELLLHRGDVGWW